MPSRELSKYIGARKNMNVAVDEDEWIMIDTIRLGICTIGIVYRLFHYSHFAIDRDVYDCVHVLRTGFHQVMGLTAVVAGDWCITKLI